MRELKLRGRLETQSTLRENLCAREAGLREELEAQAVEMARLREELREYQRVSERDTKVSGSRVKSMNN